MTLETSPFPTPLPEPPLTPGIMVDKLSQGCSFFELFRDVKGDVARLSDFLHTDEFQLHLKTRIQTSLAQAKAMAADWIPLILSKLLKITDSEKPETARRALTTLLTLAGIPTRPLPRKHPKTPPQQFPQDSPLKTQDPKTKQNPNDSTLFTHLANVTTPPPDASKTPPLNDVTTSRFNAVTKPQSNDPPTPPNTTKNPNDSAHSPPSADMPSPCPADLATPPP